MLELRASLIKEFLLLKRDIGAVAILFLMPMLLVVSISLVQQSTFDSIAQVKVRTIVVDQDGSHVARSFLAQLDNSGRFDVQHMEDVHRASQAIKNGERQLAILITPGLGDQTSDRVDQEVGKFLVQLGVGEPDSLPVNTGTTEGLQLLFDPASHPSFRTIVKMGVQQMLLRVETEQVMMHLQEQLEMEPEDGEQVGLNGFIPVQEVSLTEDNDPDPDPTQHNIPAWTVFAIFFIIVPLSINLVKERGQGTYIRLQSTAKATTIFLTGKGLAYLAVAMLQFVSILLLGVFLFPSLGLPRLEVSGGLPLLFLIALFVGLAAIGLGTLIGALASSHEQAAPFGATFVVILSALGGIWVPVFAMPAFMQKLALISPLNWGLNAFYEVLLRGGGLSDLLPWLCALFLFFVATFTIARPLYEKRSLR